MIGRMATGAAIVLITGSAAAQPGGAGPTGAGLGGDPGAPITLEADRCDLLERQQETVCEGSVRIAQGAALLTSDRVTLRFFEGTQNPRYIEGTGRVRYANGEDAIGGERGVFDAGTNTVTVTGDVVVVQGEQVLTGERLVYNTQTGALSFSAARGGRVRGLFRPGAVQRDEAGADPASAIPAAPVAAPVAASGLRR